MDQEATKHPKEETVKLRRVECAGYIYFKRSDLHIYSGKHFLSSLN